MNNRTCVDIIKNLINQIKDQYSCYVYNRDKIPPIENESFILSDQLFLDILLMEIREESIYISTLKTKRKRNFIRKGNSMFA